MMTLKEAINYGKELLVKNDIYDAEYDSFELLSSINGMDKTYFFIHSNDVVSETDFKEYERLLELRSKHVPLQHILGKAYFYGYEFYVNENVLIPRQDTEVLVENVLKLVDKDMTVIDMCTGSGCIILSIAKRAGIDEYSHGKYIGVDISSEALEVSVTNQEKLGLAGLVQFVNSNLFENISEEYKNSVDVIISNPPYIPSNDIDELKDEVKLHDPRLALDGKEDGLYFYREITKQSVEYLNEGGYLCYEIGYNQAEQVSKIMHDFGFSDIKVVKDLAGLDRVVIGIKHFK